MWFAASILLLCLRLAAARPAKNGGLGKNGENGRNRRPLIEARLAQRLVEPALERRLLEARAEAREIEIGVLALALLQRVRSLGVASELGIGAGEREIERRVGGKADARRLEQLHRIAEAPAQQIGDAEIERSLGSQIAVQPHRQLAGGDRARDVAGPQQ